VLEGRRRVVCAKKTGPAQRRSKNGKPHEVKGHKVRDSSNKGERGFLIRHGEGEFRGCSR